MSIPDLDPFEKSIMLLVIAEEVICKRRLLEQMCGYSEDYGNDHVLIKAITKHLNSPEIKPITLRVKELVGMHEAAAKTKTNGD